jgi:hypothetical protein
MRHRTYAASGTLLLAGATFIALGLAGDATPETLAGVVLCISAQMLASMRLIYRWVTDTSVVRASLLLSKQRHDEEAAKYSAGLLAIAAEQDRTRREAIAGARRRDETLKIEREALQAEFEEKRATLVCQAIEAGVRLAQSGKLDEAPARERVVVPFPMQPVDYERARDRGRDVIP